MTQDNKVHDDADFDFGWDDAFDVEPTCIIDNPALPVLLTADLIPLDRDGSYVPNHQEADGTLHFFAAVDIAEEPNFDFPLSHLRYFRVAHTGDGRVVHDSYPVMPMENTVGSPFPLPTLQLMLEEGDLDNARELAFHTAQSHGVNFPSPENLPMLNTGVDYRFETGIEDDGSPVIEAVKAWREGNEDREAEMTIANYGMRPELEVDLRELNDRREHEDLQAAMNLAEGMAVASGMLHDGRDDSRLFIDGPPDPFTTNRARERAESAFIREDGVRYTQPLTPVLVAPEVAVAGFEDQFANSAYRLLEPVDPTVNYSFEVTAADPWTLELTADKWWLENDGQVGHEGQTLKTYSLESFEWERETEREVAAIDVDNLHRTYQGEGLEAAMRQAEGIAVSNHELDPHRADGRLFTEGPPDRFTTALEVQLMGREDTHIEATVRDITNDETQELPAVSAPVPDSWEESVVPQSDDAPQPERHYWQMHYRPVETPDGEKLGTALFVTEFPQLSPDSDDYIDQNGMDDTVYPTEARTLEMAHFADVQDAARFDTEFRSYLVPGLLDGPELALEVARLEGLSGEWEEMNYQGIVDYMRGSRTVVREVENWHLHIPNAEREAQEQFEHPPNDVEL